MLKLARRHGSPSWYAAGTHLGVHVERSLRTCERKEAEILLAKIQKEIFDGECGRPARQTFAGAALSYMRNGGERRFVEPLLQHFGETPVDRIDSAAIIHAAHLLYPNAAPATRNRQIFTPASAILKSAGITLALRRPKQPPGVIRWLTGDEAARLIAVCPDHLRPLILFLLFTGARAGEALWLDWRRVDLARAHVSFPETKTGVPRGVPLHPSVIAMLANLPHRDGAVFRRPDGKPYEQPLRGIPRQARRSRRRSGAPANELESKISGCTIYGILLRRGIM